MDILVHNISHSDLIVRLATIGDELSNEHLKNTILAKPKFSVFHSAGLAIRKVVESVIADKYGMVDPSLLHTYERNMDDPLCLLRAQCSSTMYPVGFNLTSCPVTLTNIQDYRIKGWETQCDQLMNAAKLNQLKIIAVYFPLLALLIPKWKMTLEQQQASTNRKILYLISGSGIPRDSSHSIAGNSTQETGQLMIHFMKQYYPEIEVFQIHSGENIFRYDDNVRFVNRKLRPLIEAHRQTIVEKFGEKWPSFFHVTLAYADGAPARVSALNANLRIYQPSYLHIWQLKTFWHEFKLSMQDVDFHDFDNIETSPSVPVSQLCSVTRLLVSEMAKFRDHFLEAMKEPNELEHFWLRKSRKPVLAVLLVKKRIQNNVNENAFIANSMVGISSTSDSFRIYRGMNTEVSMPTGSLCAERNVIGSALAHDPTLRRQDMLMIGVLSMTLEPNESDDKKSPTDSILNPTYFFNNTQLRGNGQTTGGGDARSPTRQSLLLKKNSPRPKRQRINSLGGLDVASVRDLNPLAPCGSCKEWLLKIAETNPSLKVVTFTDISCEYVYINQVQ